MSSNSKKGAGPGTVELPEALKESRRLQADERFTFGCHAGLKCFNTCCQDINIILTPLDVLKLARRVGIETTELLSRYTIKPISKELNLPVVMLRMDEEDEKRCPFVREDGCSVYDDRPSACRMYPAGMGVPPARAGVQPEPLYILLEDDFCLGRTDPKAWTVAEWRKDQGLDEREELEQGFREIVSHPWFIGGRQLNPAGVEMFFMATYDLDTFRRFVFESTFLKRFEIEEETIDKIRTDDDELMRFGWRWLRYSLFSEPTIKVREDAPKSRGK